MGKMPKVYWLAMAYLVATVAYNSVLQWPSLVALQWDLVANLGFKSVAIVLLFYRRAEGAYLLIAAFVVGLLSTLWDFYRFGSWQWLVPLEKVARVNGFLISFAIIVYMLVLAQRGILKGRASRVPSFGP